MYKRNFKLKKINLKIILAIFGKWLDMKRQPM